MARKLGLVLILILFPPRLALQQALVATFFVLLMAVLQIILQPFRTAASDQLETLMLTLNFLTVFVGLTTFLTEDSFLKDSFSVFLAVALTVAVLYLSVSFVSNLLRVWKNQQGMAAGLGRGVEHFDTRSKKILRYSDGVVSDNAFPVLVELLKSATDLDKDEIYLVFESLWHHRLIRGESAEDDPDAPASDLASFAWSGSGSGEGDKASGRTGAAGSRRSRSGKGNRSAATASSTSTTTPTAGAGGRRPRFGGSSTASSTGAVSSSALSSSSSSSSSSSPSRM